MVIHGAGFALRATQPASGGDPAIDSRFRAWLGNIELPEVAWVDGQSLRATVPAGLPPGAYTLVVESPFGRRGFLENAFVVSMVPQAALQTTISASPAMASVGQAVQVTLTVSNAGTGDASAVTPSTPTAVSADGAAAALADGPFPASASSLRPGETALFGWIFQATAPGTLSFGVAASATDDFTGQPIVGAPDAPALTVVQRGAALSAELAAPPSAALGGEFAVTMTVSNSGEATALAVAPAALVPEPGSIPVSARSGPAPATADVPGGGSTTFTWTYDAGGTSGQVQLRGEASGRDANSGAAVASGWATSNAVTVGRAALVASLSAAPSTVSLGQPLTLTLHVGNPGSAATLNVTPSTPSVSGTGAVGPPVGPSPAVIPTLGPASTATFEWVYPATSAGQLDFSASASGVDSASGAAVSATANLVRAVMVAGHASLGVSSFTATPAAAEVNQAITLSLVLGNTGTAGAVLSSVAPTASPAGTVLCTVPSPAPPQTVAAGGTLTEIWTCTASGPGTFTLGATVAATDSGTGLPLSPPVAGVPVTVSAPAKLSTASFAASPNPATVNKAVTVSLTVANAGIAAATVSAVTPTLTPAAGATCGAVSPARPATVPAGATLTFVWTCTATAAKTYTLGAKVTATDAVSGVDVSPTVPTVSLKVNKAG